MISLSIVAEASLSTSSDLSRSSLSPGSPEYDRSLIPIIFFFSASDKKSPSAKVSFTGPGPPISTPLRFLFCSKVLVAASPTIFIKLSRSPARTLSNLCALCPPLPVFPGTIELKLCETFMAFPIRNPTLASDLSIVTRPYTSFSSTSSLRWSIRNVCSHLYVLRFIGSGGSNIHSFMSDVPSCSDILPLYMHRPLGGVTLNTLNA